MAPIYIYTKVAPVDIFTARALIEPVAALATYTLTMNCIAYISV